MRTILLVLTLLFSTLTFAADSPASFAPSLTPDKPFGLLTDPSSGEGAEGKMSETQMDMLIFLPYCAGLPVTKENFPVAAAMCASRIRGIAEGHNITVRMVLQNAVRFSKKNKRPPHNEVPVPRLWCIDGVHTTAGGLTQGVYNWVDGHKKLFAELYQTSPSPGPATEVVIVMSLREMFPCNKTKGKSKQ